MAAILNVGPEQFNISESPSHPVAQSDLRFGRRWPPWGHFESWNRTSLAILNLHNIPMPSIKFKLNRTYRSGADVI